MGRWIVGGVVCAAVAATLTSCGLRTPSATYVGDPAVASVTDQLRAEGRVAYYLGPEADGNPLTNLERVTENGPDFQFWASYGACKWDDGSCAEPVTTSTTDWRPDATGFWCRRLEPQLGVPAGEIMGELTLFTERIQVSVVHMGDREGERGGEGVVQAISLLPTLRPVGESQPVVSLPPPDPEVDAWVDEVCGTVPGQVVDHPMEDVGETLDNTHVPDFTVPRLGGGQLAWADYREAPVVIAVGDLEQVTGALRRLAPIVADSPSGATLLGLVTELDAPKYMPPPIAELEREAGTLPAPVGYASVPLPAVWFMDGAGNLGAVPDAMESGLIAFVDPSGEVVEYVPMDASDQGLKDAADGLG